jgi:formate hydrogenlyase subunit 3/multisubunit Na+/H+ antiporter MnhD subunit
MPIIVPLVTGVLALAIARLRNEFSFIGAVATLYYAVRIFLNARHGVLTYDYVTVGTVNIGLRVDGLSAFALLATAFLGLMAIVFSHRYMRGSPGIGAYYLFLLFTIGSASGVFLASDLIALLFFWGFLAAVLYGMLFLSRKEASAVAMKGLVIAAAADLLMMTGIGLLLFGLGGARIAPELKIPLKGALPIVSFALIATGALAKAGSMPFHTWIPDAAGTAPATFLGFVPGAVDKLLGIYLLVRVSTYVFDITSNMAVRNVVMAIGALTVLAAVMMALVQKDTLRLLSFHAVSQVGYMVLGIGTGTPVGIAGGIFHMINHALYKSTLFYSAGSIEHWTKETRLDRLGGLATRMPLTFFSFFFAALAISGIPPLNGFVSKWMVYQGILQLGQEGNKLWPVFLIAGMLGSVLTLASFLKVMHSVFLGSAPRGFDKIREVSVSMWMPTVLQALVCILFGVFANQIPIRLFIMPSLAPGQGLGVGGQGLGVPSPQSPAPSPVLGFWQPTLATGLILVGIALGLIIYLFGTAFKARPSDVFVGGESLSEEEGRMPGTEFYGTVKNLEHLSRLYASAEAGAMDFYNLGLRTAQGIARFVFTYVDRTVDNFYSVVSDVIVMFGNGFRAFATWFFLLLLIPILVSAGSGNLMPVQFLAIALMIGCALIALVETDFPRFMLLLLLAQLGFMLLAFSQGERIGVLAGLFQIYNSAVAYLATYLAYRLLISSSGKGDIPPRGVPFSSPFALIPSSPPDCAGRPQINDFSGVSTGMPVATLGFVVGGLSLAGMPPSGNFFSKYLLASIYPDNMTYTMIIIFVAILMLGVVLRVISQVFFGKPNADYREERGRLYNATLAVAILAIFNGVLAKPLIDLLSLIFGVTLK